MGKYDVDVGGKTYEVDAPDPETAWQYANQFHAEGEAKQARYRKAFEDSKLEQQARFAEETAALPWYQKAAINLGAGTDTVWQGAKQLVGQGGDDEDILAKRERDEIAAGSMPMGGIIQTAGEMLPTMIAGAGAGSLAMRGLSAVPKVANVLSKAVTAAKALPKAAQAAGVGGAGGLASGALRPVTGDESRAANTATDAFVGALAGPVVGKAVELGTNLARTGLGHLSERVAKGYGQKLAEERTSRQFGSELQDVTDVVAGAPQRQLPLSAAAASNDARVANFQRQNQDTNPIEWRAHEDAVQQAAARIADRATSAGSRAEALAAKRTADFQSVLEPVARGAAATPKKFTAGVKAIPDNITNALSNSKFGGMGDDVVTDVAKAFESKSGIGAALARGDTATAARQLTELRTKISLARGKYDSPGAVDVVLGQLDHTLDQTVGSKFVGKWRQALDNFSKASPEVDAAEAAAAIRKGMNEKPIDVVGEGYTPPAATRLNPDTLSGASVKAREAATNLPIAKPMADDLANLEFEMALHRRAGTGPTEAPRSDGKTMWLPGVKGHALTDAIDYLRGASAKERNKVLADALRDPVRLKELLEAAAMRRQLSRSGATFVGGTGNVAGSLTSALTEE